MGLYERLLEEKEEEERRRGRPLGEFYGLASKALDRRLEGASKEDRPPGYGAICTSSIGTRTRGCVVREQRCASPA